jgi:hypothetical protein
MTVNKSWKLEHFYSSRWYTLNRPGVVHFNRPPTMRSVHSRPWFLQPIELFCSFCFSFVLKISELKQRGRLFDIACEPWRRTLNAPSESERPQAVCAAWEYWSISSATNRQRRRSESTDEKTGSSTWKTFAEHPDAVRLNGPVESQFSGWRRTSDGWFGNTKSGFPS